MFCEGTGYYDTLQGAKIDCLADETCQGVSSCQAVSDASSFLYGLCHINFPYVQLFSIIDSYENETVYHLNTGIYYYLSHDLLIETFRSLYTSKLKHNEM